MFAFRYDCFRVNVWRTRWLSSDDAWTNSSTAVTTILHLWSGMCHLFLPIGLSDIIKCYATTYRLICRERIASLDDAIVTLICLHAHRASIQARRCCRWCWSWWWNVFVWCPCWCWWWWRWNANGAANFIGSHVALLKTRKKNKSWNIWKFLVR